MPTPHDPPLLGLDARSPATPLDPAAIAAMVAEVRALGAACDAGDLAQVQALLARHPEVLDSPDHDERFVYPESMLWSPLYRAARAGHEAVVAWLLAQGANPIPYERAAQYHEHTYGDWLDQLADRGYGAIVARLKTAIAVGYGPLVDAEDLLQAVRDGDRGRVETLLAEHPERIRQVDAAGNTALHWAVVATQPAIARVLIGRGADLEAQNGDGRTPSIVALFGLHRYWRFEVREEIYNLLQAAGARRTVLAAATLGDDDAVEALLAADPGAANRAEPCRRRPLSVAAAQGQLDIVRLLLRHGADPVAKEATCQGGGALHAAAWRGDLAMVRLLLAAGAVPRHWIDSSGDAMFAAHHRGHEQVLNALYAHGGTMELCVYAAAHRVDVIAEILALAPQRADEVLPYGWNEGGTEEAALAIMQLAIRHGARFEAASAWNLRWTVKAYPEVFRLLCRYGADPSPVLHGIAGDMARRWPDPVKRWKTLDFLVTECDADVNVRDGEGLSALAAAAREGHEDVVDYLLEQGATPLPSGPAWQTPLHLAERGGHTAVADRLRQAIAAAGSSAAGN